MFKQEIIDKKFSRAFQGYDIAEVDYFLDEIYRELSFRDREEDALRAQIEELHTELEAQRAENPVAPEESEELCFIEEHIEEHAAADIEPITTEPEALEATVRDEAQKQEV